MTKTAHTMTKDKEILLDERRQLVEKISKVEEIDVRAASTVQHRYFLESKTTFLNYYSKNRLPFTVGLGSFLSPNEN